jgi:hypothetical protein
VHIFSSPEICGRGMEAQQRRTASAFEDAPENFPRGKYALNW